MKVLKFGGKSLAPGAALDGALKIMARAHADGSVILVVSAMGDSTDRLLTIYHEAAQKKSTIALVEEFWRRQERADDKVDLSDLKRMLQTAIDYLQVGSPAKAIRDHVVSIGELVSSRVVASRLIDLGVPAEAVDARSLIMVSEDHGRHVVDQAASSRALRDYISTMAEGVVPVITGYIASDDSGMTTTLGRNGTNLTASLVAHFIDAEEVQNWTNVDGIFAANPKYVKHAKKIDQLTFRQAHELANFGVNVLHPETINPLIEKKIPLRILNSFRPGASGTLISESSDGQRIKAVSAIENVALITIEGKGLIGRIGIDARIFNLLDRLSVSVRLISQASSERGVGFVVDLDDAQRSVKALQREFKEEIERGDISAIESHEDKAIVAIVGRHNYALEKAIHGLRKNKIWLYLISNSISGEHISLVIDRLHVRKAINVVYEQVFRKVKRVRVFAFGKGTVGGQFLDQITEKPSIPRSVDVEIRLIGIADSRRFILDPDGIEDDWRDRLASGAERTSLETLDQEISVLGLQDVIMVDNTSSDLMTAVYVNMLSAGYHLVTSNKKANSGPLEYYRRIQSTARARRRKFLYETNVGAGLPIIDTIRQLTDAGDQVTKIRGLFSGSLSYIFYHFSQADFAFSEILAQARDKGYTEPDPREDLNGLDVARKLVILAREIGMQVELEDVSVDNLIPETLRDISSVAEFMKQTDVLDTHYAHMKSQLRKGQVLRYVAELDTSQDRLAVSLASVDPDEQLANAKNADAMIEIYTTTYGDQPITIQGPGAGGAVTARGVYTDVMRMAKML